MSWSALWESPQLRWFAGLAILGLTGWLSLAAIGALVAMMRDRSPIEGFVVTLVFGPLGIWFEVSRGHRQDVATADKNEDVPSRWVRDRDEPRS